MTVKNQHWLVLLSVVAILRSGSITSTNAYIVRPATTHPNLKQFAEAQLGKLMDIRFVIQSKAEDAGSLLALQGPLVKFVDHVADKLKKTKADLVQMPVADGPNRRLSSGAKSLDIVKEGFVVDMNGKKAIPFQKGSWEMAWKDGQRFGSIICAFDLPEEVYRNEASIPACHVFTQFLVWTKESLLEDQAHRRLMEDNIRDFEKEKQEARVKYEETSNPFAKLKHMHALYQAMENVMYTPRVVHIPLDDSDLIELDDGLLMSKKGTLWTTSRSSGKNFFGGMARPSKLGHATINLVEEDGTDNASSN